VLQVYRRVRPNEFRCVYQGEGPAFSRELGAWLVVTDGGERLRIADDAAGTRLWPTASEEARRASEEARRASEEARRASEEARRASEEAQQARAVAEAENARLRAELEALRGAKKTRRAR
jgi:hypothetical protein